MSSPFAPSRRLDGLGAQRNVVFFKPSHCFRAHLRPIAANHHVRHPVLHHNGELRPFISFAIGGYRLPCILKTIAVKTMMHGNPVEGFDSSQFRKLVNETRREKDFRGGACRAVRADKFKSVAGER